MPKLTAATVNKELKRIGAEERLVRGEGYYYFVEGDAHMWPTCSVYVFRADDLTLREWIDEYHGLKENKFIALDTPE